MPDPAGRSVVPGFAEPHAHLDRPFRSAITGWNRSGWAAARKRWHEPTGGPGGLAPIRWLRDPGVAIGIGLDNIREILVPVGTAEPLRAAWLVAVAAHLTGEDDLEWLGRTVTAGTRRICHLPEDVGEGGPDDQLVIDAVNLAEAVALVPPRQRLLR
jgi:cytosine/adenosine deaminase-related metal-dependent hydrolase